MGGGCSRWNLGDISFRSGDTMYFSVYYSEFQLEKLFPVAILVFRVVRELQILTYSVAHSYRLKVTKAFPLVPHGYFRAILKLVVR